MRCDLMVPIGSPTASETARMEATVKLIIQRVGEWAADPNAPWPQITMEDFPRL